MFNVPTRLSTLVTPAPAVAKPQAALFWRQTVPVASGSVMTRLAVGAVKPSVEVKPLALTAMVLLELPCMVVM